MRSSWCCARCWRSSLPSRRAGCLSRSCSASRRRTAPTSLRAELTAQQTSAVFYPDARGATAGPFLGVAAPSVPAAALHPIGSSCAGRLSPRADESLAPQHLRPRSSAIALCALVLRSLRRSLSSPRGVGRAAPASRSRSRCCAYRDVRSARLLITAGECRTRVCSGTRLGGLETAVRLFFCVGQMRIPASP